MATKVKPSRIQISGTPQVGDVPLYVDQDTFQWGVGGGNGDVTGPASSTDGDIVLFDGNTGKLIKDSNTTINSLQPKLTAGTGIDITGNVISNTQTSAEWGNITGTLSDQTDLNTALTNITDVIPSAATSSNQLADKNYVNDGINSVTAYYITKDAAGNQFATYAELAAASTFYSGGVARVPTRNDYTIVLADENHDNACTRYIYNSGWEYQYTVNETALTQTQLDALNSGITSGKVSTYDGYATTIAGKQDALTLPATPTQGNLVTWGADNETLVDGGAIPTGVPSGGNNGDVLTNVSGTPSWQAPAAGGIENDTTGTTTTISKMWAGTSTEYNNLGTISPSTIYYVF